MVGHEEIVITTDIMDLPDDQGVAVAHSITQELKEFAERDTLWRIRESNYRAGYGAPFAWYLTITAGYRKMKGWGSLATNVEPEWIQPPARQQYAADLRRFPIVRQARPNWLRKHCGRVCCGTRRGLVEKEKIFRDKPALRS